jgi:hypothetical protein
MIICCSDGRVSKNIPICIGKCAKKEFLSDRHVIFFDCVIDKVHGRDKKTLIADSKTMLSKLLSLNKKG